MAPYLSARFGNPSSLYRLGREAQAAIDDARDRVAAVLGCRPGEVVFTSGGTESINLALKGVAFAQQLAGVGDRIVSTTVEHHAVLHTLEFLERFGFEIERVEVDGEGRVDPAAVAAAVDDRTVLVNVMLANNEVGTVQPVAAVAAALRDRAAALGRGVPLHTDAVQAPGQLPLDVGELGVDLLSISAHKFRGPKGVGALFLRRGTPFLAQQTGGGQERARRAGTENPGGIVGMGVALELAEQQRELQVRHTCAACATASSSGRCARSPEPCETARRTTGWRTTPTCASKAWTGNRCWRRSTPRAWRPRAAAPARRSRGSRATCCWRWASTRTRRRAACASASGSRTAAATWTPSSSCCARSCRRCGRRRRS